MELRQLKYFLKVAETLNFSMAAKELFITQYNGDPLSIASLEIKSTLPNRLSRLKRQSPEAFYYWAKTSELL
jgi:hypothetical protein